MNISFAVQAHPSRSTLASALADRVGGEVVWDPDPAGKRSTWRTFRHLLATTPLEATHRVQLQDDATACPGFAEAVRRAVDARPGHLLVFYVGTQRPRYRDAVLAACRADVPWAELEPSHWLPVVSTCWPRALLEGLLEHSHDWPGAYGADDEIVGGYMKRIGHRPLATVPSLVEHHDDAPPVRTVQGPPVRAARGRTGTGRERKAACYVGECQECVDGIDWTQGPGG